MGTDRRSERVIRAGRNILYGYLGQVATALMSFYLRRVFIRYLSETLLGINATYTNVLSLLSMAELGIGMALNFSLYAPVAAGDREKVKSYVQMYRRAYRVIAGVVTALGLALVPALPWLVKGPVGVSTQELILYYLIFLFNTVTTYLVSYKYSLVNAEQKNYIQTNILTLTKVLVILCQIVVLHLTGNFLAFLLTDLVLQLLQKIFVSRYLDRLYPILLERDIQPLSREESGTVWRKTGALLLHKIGDVLRLQTDAIVISSMIQVAAAGFVDNYMLVLSALSNFANIIFNSVISSFGNVVATESRERQQELYKVYRFFAAWVYGFSTVGFFLLLTPLVRLWLGDAWALPVTVVGLILTDYYLKGYRIVNSNFKTAAGIFEQDKYLALFQGIVNLVLSVWLARRIGLAGVYIGTVVSGLIANVTKPFIIYRDAFHKPVLPYFTDAARFFAVTFASILICLGLGQLFLQTVTIPRFLLGMLLVTVVFNALFLLAFRGRMEFLYLRDLAKRHLPGGR